MLGKGEYFHKKGKRVDSRRDSLYNHSERKGGVFHRIPKHEKPVF